jgi:NADH dehydrogenase FAD-containing subunit
MGKHLVVAGGGHAHMTLLLRLGEFIRKGHRISVVSPSRYQYYSGMGPGMLSGIYEPREIRFNVGRMAEDRGASFIEDRAVRIDPAKRVIFLGSGKDIPYDIATFNTGSQVPAESLDASSAQTVPVKPIINLYQARLGILAALERRNIAIAVIGGGPAGVEIGANLWRLAQGRPHGAEITLVGGRKILADFPGRVRSLALDSLESRNINILEGIRAQSSVNGVVILSNGKTLCCDFVFVAVGVKPSSLFLDSGIPTGKDGGLLVNPFLQSTTYPELFGGGDCISLAGNPLAKVGVYAVRQNPVLLHNLMAALEGGSLIPFRAGGTYMLIMNMGNGTGIFWKKNLVLDGRPAFLLKDFIDRRFMKKFQVSGELEEPGEEII